MPKQDVNVVIGKMDAKSSDLEETITTLPAEMTKAASEFFKKQSGYALKKPTDKLDSGFKISGNVISLKKQTKGGRELVMATVSLVISEMPRDKMLPGKTEGTGGVSLSKDLKGDAEFAVATATQEACKMALKQLEKAAKA